ncbi:hypothetical protein HELRODRAFT_159498 [Helobdella robusta]|uniref:Protein-tyrosine-phosphatase n=1 Tax=Helobdella robusta TaxID=6412 RepID=T1EP36_HELRO|nr:hypothetical protein HELRODRAFT_159498 [Helobdella robusta]ESO12910.1 hypothetical protein HELRODRAFT_159498 [Helobdella robusta]
MAATTRNTNDQIDRVLDHLYIGSVFSLSLENIKRANIKLIIDCTVEGNGKVFPGVEQIQIPIDDSFNVNIATFFDLCADAIDACQKRGGSTLIHCTAGISRSATFCIAYLMKYKRMRLRQAYNRLKSVRYVIRPNENFFEQLILYELTLFGSNTVSMIQSMFGRIPDVYGRNIYNFVPVFGQ